jgi:hypothetical protein
MQLHHIRGNITAERRDLRLLIQAGCNHDVLGFEAASAGVNHLSIPTTVRFDGFDLHTVTNGKVKAIHVVFKVGHKFRHAKGIHRDCRLDTPFLGGRIASWGYLA